MNLCPELRVLFCAPAGPRRGFGHLVRCRALARALGVRPLICLRGPRGAADVALRLGCDVVTGTASQLMPAIKPDLVIVDDPIPGHASRWIAAARAAGATVVSIHDLGLGGRGADLRIDGSVTLNGTAARGRHALGPAFAIVDPMSPRSRAVRGSDRPRVVISLGGGPRARVACDIAREIARRAPDVDVRVVGGFVSRRPPAAAWKRCPANVEWMGAAENLRAEIAPADVAVVGGGVSLYEACALGVPAVGVAVVPAQRKTVAGFVSRGAALGNTHSSIVPRRVADDALALLRQQGLRRRVTRTARRLVDGRGASRAAEAINRLFRGQ